MTRYFAKEYAVFDTPKSEDVVFAQVDDETSPLTVYSLDGRGKRMKNMGLNYVLAAVQKGHWYECTRADAHKLCKSPPRVLDEPETAGGGW